MSISWKPVSKTVVVAGIAAAALFWVHALTARGGFLVLDYVNLPVHEAGHLVFGLFGPGFGVWGGTLMQLIIPASFVVYFALRGETTGTAFSAFWLGESGLYSGTYIADARAMQLPLAGGGEHDWNIILSRLNLLRSDRAIGDVVRFLGWALMLSAVYFLFSKRERGATNEDMRPAQARNDRGDRL